MISTMAAWSRTQIRLRAIVTSQIRAGRVKMDEHKHDEHDWDFEKKVAFFTFWMVFEKRNLIL